jgi:hypothetical protein
MHVFGREVFNGQLPSNAVTIYVTICIYGPVLNTEELPDSYEYQMIRPPFQTLEVLDLEACCGIVIYCFYHLSISAYGNWSFLAKPPEEWIPHLFSLLNMCFCIIGL